jgi:hypothetical protein
MSAVSDTAGASDFAASSAEAFACPGCGWCSDGDFNDRLKAQEAMQIRLEASRRIFELCIKLQDNYANNKQKLDCALSLDSRIIA